MAVGAMVVEGTATPDTGVLQADAPLLNQQY